MSVVPIIRYSLCLLTLIKENIRKENIALMGDVPPNYSPVCLLALPVQNSIHLMSDPEENS